MYVVCNRVPVAEGYEEEFERRFRNRLGEVEKAPGFVRSVLLRPVESSYYVVEIYWTGIDAFKTWTTSESFRRAHADRPPSEMFAGPNQLETYEVIAATEPKA